MKILKRLMSICLSVAMLSVCMVIPVSAASTSITIKSSNTDLYFVKNTTSYGGIGSLATNYAIFRKTCSIIVPIKVDKTALYSLTANMWAASANTKITAIKFKWDYIAESKLELDETNTTYAMAAHTSITSYGNTCYNYKMPASGGSTAHDLGTNIILEADEQYYLKIYAENITSNNAIYMNKLTIAETGSPLQALTISDADIVPEFDGIQTDYTVYTTMPSSEKLTISATAVKPDAVVKVNTTEGTGSAAEDVAISYGINQTAIPISVTDSDGNTYSYNFKIVVREENDVALGNTTATSSGLATSTGLSDLFTESGATSKSVVIKSKVAGYIQLDLGREYNLCKFQWTYSAGYPLPLTIIASKDDQFSEPITLGTTKSGKTSCSLDYNEKYRYIRISKDITLYSDTSACYFYPTSLRIYALADVEETTDTSTIVTVPSRYYTVGEQLIAATYNSNGRLVSADIKPAENAYETKLNITKASEEDKVKVMIWDSIANRNPMVDSITPVTVSAQ